MLQKASNERLKCFTNMFSLSIMIILGDKGFKKYFFITVGIGTNIFGGRMEVTMFITHFLNSHVCWVLTMCGSCFKLIKGYSKL